VTRLEGKFTAVFEKKHHYGKPKQSAKESLFPGAESDAFDSIEGNVSAIKQRQPPQEAKADGQKNQPLGGQHHPALSRQDSSVQGSYRVQDKTFVTIQLWVAGVP
jgi:hypothetical protein